MGIINITPDSFFDGGSYNNVKSVLKRVDEIIGQGGDIVDIGAYSSRPGAKHISVNEELSRLLSIMDAVRNKFPDIIISIDTFRSEIARKLVREYNVDIINDISAGELDKNMFDTIADLQVPYIIMHMLGKPENMQKNPVYENLINDVMKYFSSKLEKLKLLGVNDIIIDPGFGFGKTMEDNYLLFKNLPDFAIFELPILIGVSRKSMIHKFLGTDSENSLNGTTVLHSFALQSGVNILRVHDVKEAVEVCKIHNKLKSL